MALNRPAFGTGLHVRRGMGNNTDHDIVRHHSQRISLSKLRNRNSVTGSLNRQKMQRVLRMADKLAIVVAPTGALNTREHVHYMAYTVEEQAEEARRCEDAGLSLSHC